MTYQLESTDLRQLSSALLSGPAILAFGILLGLASPKLAALVGPLLPTTVFVFVFGTFLRADVSSLRQTIWQPWTSICIPALLMTLVPITIYFALVFFEMPKEVLLAVLLASLCPPSSGNAALSRMMGYVGEFPLTVILVTMMLAPVTVPLVAWLLIGIEISPLAMAQTLFIFLFTTAGLAIACRLVLRENVRSSIQIVDKIVLAALFLFAIATMDGVQAQIREDPARAGMFIAIAFGTNIIMQALGFFLVRGTLESRLASALTAGNRNVGLIWATMDSLVSPTVALFFAATQLPIFILPLFMRLLKAALDRRV